MEGEKNPVGRPKEPVKLWEGWYSEVLEKYAEGASDVEIKALIYFRRGSFSNDLWERWVKEEEEFSETIKVGKMLSEAWWSSQGRTNLKSKEFNYVGWYMNMKNRFGWKDKTETELSGELAVRPIIGMEVH
jgi:hypothetical protein